MPEISVVVAGYNCEETLEACLQSVRASEGVEYELIVVDDGSRDETPEIAQKYADYTIKHRVNLGRWEARLNGFRHARAPLIVNIDSDVRVFPDTLKKIRDFFSQNEEITALTGLLAREHPHKNYISQYKNLYMAERFRSLPKEVSFLYGSIYAIRKADLEFFEPGVSMADDTALGQELVRKGKKIGLLKDLEVVHLKKYGFFTWAMNDFRIPYDWARIFLRRRGWRQFGKYGSGFCHASLGQVASLVLAPLVFLLAVCSLNVPACLLALLWFFLNLKFHYFLKKEKGWRFAFAGIPVTFLDHLIMFSGVLAGFVSSLRLLRSRRRTHLL